MELIFLGTGTSQGVPPIACDSPGCDLNNSKNWRTRSSVHVVMDGFHIQVDAAPEFRLQCLFNQICDVNLFILTHGHSDHIMGMDDLRRFCEMKGGQAIDVYSTEEGLERVHSIYPYAIREKSLYKGYVALQTHLMPKCLELDCGRIFSTRLPHGSIDVLGLVFEEKSSGKRLAYYTDCKCVTPQAHQLAKGVDVAVLDGLRQKPHPTHMTIEEAVESAFALEARQAFLTHMTHFVDYEKTSSTLPPQVRLAYDNLRIII